MVVAEPFSFQIKFAACEKETGQNLKGLRGYCLVSVGIFCHFFHSIDDELGIAHQPTGINDINLAVLNCFDMTESGVFVNLPGCHGIRLAVFLRIRIRRDKNNIRIDRK